MRLMNVVNCDFVILKLQAKSSKMVNNIIDLGRIEYTLKGPFADGAIEHLNSASSRGFPTKCPQVRLSDGSRLSVLN